MKICYICGEIFSNDKFETCPYCGNNDLKVIRGINVNSRDGKFEGSFEKDIIKNEE